ncbi:MAG: hypothetical protein ACEQSX_17080 [Baekduiaceae bacterium]
MGLPTTRDQTFSVGVPVPAVFLNNTQDSIIAHEQKKDLSLAMLQGLLGVAAFADGASVVARPIGVAGVSAQRIDLDVTGLTYSFVGGLWMASGGPDEYPWFPCRLETESVTFGARPGAGLFRRDIVSIKLTRSGHIVTADLVVTAGTPAATAVLATEPATPATRTKICSVLHSDSATDPLKVRDYRVPAFIDRIASRTFGGGMQSSGNAFGNTAGTYLWANGGVASVRSSGVLSAVLEIFPPGLSNPATKRLKSVHVASNLNGSPTAALKRVPFLSGTHVEVDLVTDIGAPVITPPTTDSVWSYIADLAADVPIWGHGKSAPSLDDYFVEGADRTALQLHIVAGSTSCAVFGAEWAFFGGPFT